MMQARWIATALLLLTPGLALAEESKAEPFRWWVDLRGSLTASVPDFERLAGPSAEEPEPGLRFYADGDNNLFFEGYDTSTGGSPSLWPTRLNMDDQLARDLAWIPGFTAVAGLERDLPGQGTVELILAGWLFPRETSVRFHDQGSRLRLGWPVLRGRLVLELLPFGGDWLRVGDGLATGWGEPDLGQARTFASGAQLAHFGRDHSLFLALRGTRISIYDFDTGDTGSRGTYLLMAGGGFQVLGGLRVQLGLGHSLAPPPLERAGVREESIHQRGGTLSLEWSSDPGLPVRGQRIPLLAEGAVSDSAFERSPSGAGPWWHLRLEGSWIQQQLEDLDDPGQMTWQPAAALGQQLVAGWRGWESELGYLLQGPAFLLREAPGLISYVAFTPEMELLAGHRGWIAVKRSFLKGQLRSGLEVGIRRPSAVVVPEITAGPNPAGPLTETRALLVHSDGSSRLLPRGERPVPELDVRLELSWWIVDDLVTSVQLFVRQNGNLAEFQNTAAGETVSVFTDPFSVGLNLALRFRFATDSSADQVAMRAR